MKNTNRFLSYVLVAVMILSIGAVATACQTEEAYGMNYSYVSVSINPKADFVVGADGLIVDVIPMNEGAEVLLADGTDAFIGLTPEAAVELFTNMAVEAGYIDPETQEANVNVEVISDEGEDKAKDIAEKIRSKVNGYFANKGIFGKVNIESLDEYLAQAEALGIDVNEFSLGKIKALLTAMSVAPEMDLAELSQMSVGELIKVIHQATTGEKIKGSNSEFIAAKKELYETEYTQIEVLKSEIKALNDQISALEDGEEKTALIAERDAKIAELETLKAEYKDAVEALKEEIKGKITDETEKKEKEREQKVKETEQKLKEHEAKVKQEGEKLKEKIKEMQQNGQKNK